MKSAAFSEEREWRLAIPGYPAGLKPSFRVAIGGIIPYVALRFDFGSIAEVVIGPTVDRDRGRIAVEALLKASGIAQVTISTSGIPFMG